VSIQDLLGRKGVVYCKSDIEINLPIDEGTKELRDYLRDFKTLEDYMRLDEEVPADLPKKEVVHRCKLPLNWRVSNLLRHHCEEK
jgi:hypothetical protein